MTTPALTTLTALLANPLRRMVRRYRRTGRHRLSRHHIGWEGNPDGLISLHDRTARDGA